MQWGYMLTQVSDFMLMVYYLHHMVLYTPYNPETPYPMVGIPIHPTYSITVPHFWPPMVYLANDVVVLFISCSYFILSKIGETEMIQLLWRNARFCWEISHPLSEAFSGDKFIILDMSEFCSAKQKKLHSGNFSHHFLNAFCVRSHAHLGWQLWFQFWLFILILISNITFYFYFLFKL